MGSLCHRLTTAALSRRSSNLVIVDATNFGGRPQAIIELPARVPAGFHGTWVPAS
ncbi:carotenoid oxygenase family protein [Sorangium sp. So ce362]|uniref:carotenoid oxygenase family protein n=1 Tax=Sorangium sp. So ce362 TaxID=3133303 RepID=UPI003F647BC4